MPSNFAPSSGRGCCSNRPISDSQLSTPQKFLRRRSNSQEIRDIPRRFLIDYAFRKESVVSAEDYFVP